MTTAKEQHTDVPKSWAPVACDAEANAGDDKDYQPRRPILLKHATNTNNQSLRTV